MLGPFYKDIWEMIFSYFEINFCKKTLNSLSVTCKKLNLIDKERKSRHRNDLMKKCERIGFDVYKISHPELSKARPDYVSLHKYIK